MKRKSVQQLSWYRIESLGTAFKSSLLDVRRIIDFAAIISSGLLSRFLVAGGTFSKIAFLFIVTGSIFQFLFLLPSMLKERSWRTVSAYEAVSFFKGSFAITAIFVTLNLLFLQDSSWTFWAVVNLVVSVHFLCGMRLTRRMLFEYESKIKTQSTGRATLIFGTGSAARSLATRFQSEPGLGIRLVGYIDDDGTLKGRLDRGTPVLGTPQDLPFLLAKHCIEQLIFASVPKDGARLKMMLQEAHNLRVQTKILTDIGLKNSKNETSELFRDVSLQDLLQRPRVEVDLGSTERLISGETVLVSGGGGSIGSELIRQIAKMNPARILALDHSEFNLYEIESELKRIGRVDVLVPILSDLKEPEIIKGLIKKYQPTIVFHAAAYKHVHLVENNANASIINNLFTLKNLLEASLGGNVQNFVLISTDKAVNPKGVMGCTKRACELMVSQAAAESGRRYCSVRFGNVLGSSGSFIPLLKRQILEGGPVTITHPEMERYFMLIPEAVSLVLKAASISSPGDINVLKMGNSIKILDIARSLMVLLGKPEGSVPIVFTGMRPGEKLREELYLRGDELNTLHPDIMVLPRGAQGASDQNHPKKSALARVEEIIQLARKDDGMAEVFLKNMVEFNELVRVVEETGVINEDEKYIEHRVA